MTQHKNTSASAATTKSEPSTEISGGEVRATTASKRGSTRSLTAQTNRKLAKFTTRRHFDFCQAPAKECE